MEHDEEYEERAAILEFDAGLDRLEAEREARRLLAADHAQHRQDRITSMAMHLAGQKTKKDRDTEIAKLEEKYKTKPETVTEIIALAKKLYGEKK